MRAEWIEKLWPNFVSGRSAKFEREPAPRSLPKPLASIEQPFMVGFHALLMGATPISTQKAWAYCCTGPTRILYYTIVDKTPEQMKMPFALWSCALIQEFIRRRFGINLSKITVSRVLAKIGLSFQRPLQRAYEQNTTLVKSWLKEEFPKIEKLAKREKAEVFFEDESGVRSDAQVGKTWGRVVKPRLSKPRANDSA